MQFLSRSLDDVDNEEWLMEVGNAMGDKDMLLKYSSYPEEKVAVASDDVTMMSLLTDPPLRGSCTSAWGC